VICVVMVCLLVVTWHKVILTQRPSGAGTCFLVFRELLSVGSDGHRQRETGHKYPDLCRGAFHLWTLARRSAQVWPLVCRSRFWALAMMRGKAQAIRGTLANPAANCYLA